GDIAVSLAVPASAPDPTAALLLFDSRPVRQVEIDSLDTLSLCHGSRLGSTLTSACTLVFKQARTAVLHSALDDDVLVDPIVTTGSAFRRDWSGASAWHSNKFSWTMTASSRRGEQCPCRDRTATRTHARLKHTHARIARRRARRHSRARCRTGLRRTLPNSSRDRSTRSTARTTGAAPRGSPPRTRSRSRAPARTRGVGSASSRRSEEHTSELQ